MKAVGNKKICSSCKIEKNISDFHKNPCLVDGLSNICKFCCSKKAKLFYLKHKERIDKEHRNYSQKRRSSFPWFNILSDIKQRCNNPKNEAYKYYGGRGIKCLITEEEIKKLWFRDKAYEMKRPSIDRENNEGDYIYDNCRFIEQSKNSTLMNIVNHKRKIVLQFDLQGNFIKEWESITKASQTLQINIAGIGGCLQGRYKTSGGFIWKLKEEINVGK